MATTAFSEPAERHGRVSWLLVGAALLALAWLSFLHRWMSDDGFIYLRVVQNVRAGHGPVFNAGERVEAATGPMWVVVLAIGDLLTPLKLEWLAVYLGIAATVVGCGGVAIGAMTTFRRGLDDTSVLVPFGLAVVVAIPAVWDYASSGLETGLALAWIGVAFAVLARWAVAPDWRSRRVPLGTAVLVGLGCLVRPDLLLFTITFGTVLLVPSVGERPRRRRLRVAAAMATIPVAYEVFRAGYYGALVPNTAFAKEGSELRVHQGLRYATNFFGSYWLVIPGIVVAIALVLVARALHRAGIDGALAIGAACVTAGVLDIVYTVAIGGSHMEGRLFLPGLLGVVAPVAVVPWRRRTAAAVAIVLAWTVVCAAGLRPPKGYVEVAPNYYLPNQTGIVDLRAYFVTITRDAHPISSRAFVRLLPAKYWRAQQAPRGEYIDPPGLVGVTAYRAGPHVYVFDELGLADWLTGRLPLDRKLTPDHQKNTGLWLPARLVEISGAQPAHADPITAAALRALDCGDLRDLREATTDDLTVGRFFENIGTAFELQGFRLSADPRVAARRLCGATVKR